MNNLVTIAPPKPNENEETGTNVKRFLSMRGTLMMKEFRDVNVIKCEYGKKINIATVIISTMATTTKRSEIRYGIKFEALDEDGQDAGTAFMDFDEFDELISALEYINKLAQEMFNQQRDYTEVHFITKDNIKFGFFQQEGRQLGFIELDNYRGHAFLSLPMLDFVRKNVVFAKDFLLSKGATV
jgi:glutaredoxin-related protein